MPHPVVQILCSLQSHRLQKRPSTQCLCSQRHKLNIKDKRRVWWDHTTSSARSISKLRWNLQNTFLSNLSHAAQPRVRETATHVCYSKMACEGGAITCISRRASSHPLMTLPTPTLNLNTKTAQIRGNGNPSSQNASTIGEKSRLTRAEISCHSLHRTWLRSAGSLRNLP